MIQNEIITLIGNKIKNEIINGIKKAKYYTILFDCTPDIKKIYQINSICQHRLLNNLVIEESFVNFIQRNQKTGKGLTTKILKKTSI